MEKIDLQGPQDPVEKTEAYKQAMLQVQPILDREFRGRRRMFGMCHFYWRRKQELLRQYGVEWQSPAERCPWILFD